MSKSNFVKIISYSPKLSQAYFVKRIKRFFVQFAYDKFAIAEEDLFWAHTNNTGSMLSLINHNNPILVSKSDNPNRKLPYTLEAICPKSNQFSHSEFSNEFSWVGVNTALPNKFLQALFNYQIKHKVKLLPFASGYDTIKMEVRYEDSRLDAKISSSYLEMQEIFVECKNVSLVEDSMAAFPDAVSERAIKHLNVLQDLLKAGSRAVMLYVTQRLDAKCFSPADYIDPNYAKALKTAILNGVEVYIIKVQIRPDGAYFAGELPLAPCFLDDKIL